MSDYVTFDEESGEWLDAEGRVVDEADIDFGAEPADDPDSELDHDALAEYFGKVGALHHTLGRSDALADFANEFGDAYLEAEDWDKAAARFKPEADATPAASEQPKDADLGSAIDDWLTEQNAPASEES